MTRRPIHHPGGGASRSGVGSVPRDCGVVSPGFRGSFQPQAEAARHTPVSSSHQDVAPGFNKHIPHDVSTPPGGASKHAEIHTTNPHDVASSVVDLHTNQRHTRVALPTVGEPPEHSREWYAYKRSGLEYNLTMREKQLEDAIIKRGKNPSDSTRNTYIKLFNMIEQMNMQLVQLQKSFDKRFETSRG